MWLACVIGAGSAAGLAADVVVAGMGRAAGLAGVIVGFCELGALVLGVAARTGEQQARSERREGRVPEVADEGGDGRLTGGMAGKYVVDARHSRGVQVGDRSVQRNDFRSAAAAGGPGGVDG